MKILYCLQLLYHLPVSLSLILNQILMNLMCLVLIIYFVVDFVYIIRRALMYPGACMFSIHMRDCMLTWMYYCILNVLPL